MLLASGITGIGSSIAQGFGAHNAAQAQKDAANKAMDLQRDVYGQQRRDQAPWMEGGSQTLAQLLREMQNGGFEPQVNSQSLANDQGFQFRMSEGQKALERSAAARGGLNSGAAMKSLARFSQGLASDEYGNAWNRSMQAGQNRFNRMSNIAGMGQQSAGAMGAFGGQYANNMSNLYGAIGNADAAGSMGVANAVSSGFQSLGNLAQMGAGQMQSGGFGGGQQSFPTQQGNRIQQQTPAYGPGYGRGY